jgi:hypothetical protein
MFNKSLITAAIAGIAAAAPETERVLALPGMPAFDTYPVYSGYLNIPNTTKKLHYLFVES